MNSRFFGNIVFLVLINVLIKPFYVFFIEASVQNEVGPSAYGIYFSLFNFCYLFQIIIDLGIQNFNVRSISQDRNLVNDYLPKVLGLKIILSCLFLIVISLFAWFIQYPDSYLSILWVVAVNQIIVSFILFLRSNLSALGHYTLDSVLSVIDKIILIIVLAYLLWFYAGKENFTINWFIYAQLFSFCACLVIVILVCVYKIGFFKLRLVPSFSLDLIKKSLPYALIILLMAAYSRVDGIMLERLLDDGGEQAGIYAASYRILDALNIVGFLFAGLLLPMFSKLLSDKNSITPLLTLAFKLLFFISVTIAIFTTLYGEGVLSWLYPNHADEYYHSILKYLIWGFAFIACTHVFGTLLTANASLSMLNAIFFVGLIMNIVLNYIFIPTYEALAASISTLLTEGFVAVGCVILATKYFALRVNWVFLLRLTLYGLIVFIIFYLSFYYLNLNWIEAFLLGSSSSIVVSLLLRLIKISELRALVPDRMRLD